MRRRPLDLRHAPVLAALALTISLAACGDADDDSSGATTAASTTDDTVTDMSLVPATQPSVPEVEIPASIPTELVVTELAPGEGPPAVAGDVVVVHYVGVRSETGEQFDASFGGQPLSLTLGGGDVIAGWDQGLTGATAGQRLQLDIPAELAYGDEPRGDVIQAGDALTFLIDVLAVVPAVDPANAPTADDIPTSDEAVAAPVVEDVRAGDGASLDAGMTGVFHLVAARADDGTVLSSTWDAGAPQPLTIVPEQLVPGLADSLTGMQVGGRRVITLPYDASSGLTPETDVVIVADLLSAYQ